MHGYIYSIWTSWGESHHCNIIFNLCKFVSLSSSSSTELLILEAFDILQVYIIYRGKTHLGKCAHLFATGEYPNNMLSTKLFLKNANSVFLLPASSEAV